MAQGMLKTFSDTVTTQRTIANLILNIDPNDVPCLTMFGKGKEKSIRMQNFPNHKVEWLEDTLRVRTSTIGEDLDDSETGVDVADGTMWRPGDVLLVDSEKLYVSSIASNTLTVLRGWGSTSGAAHSNGATITYLFNAREEGDDSDDQPYTVPTNLYNYSQIFQGEVKVSGSEMKAVSRYGIPDSYKYQMMKLLGGSGGGNGRKGNAGDLMIDLEKTFFYGERLQRSSGVAGAMGGVDTFVTTNLTAMAGAALDPVTIENAVEDAWGYGGKPNVIVTNSWGHRKITSFYQGQVRTERREDVGGIVITTVRTHFGDLDILLNRWCPSNKMYILQRDLLGWVTLRDWFEEPLAKSGDYVKGQVIGEYSFIITNEKAHAIISGFSTTT